MPRWQSFSGGSALVAISLATCAPVTPPKMAVQPASFATGRILLVRSVTPPAADGPLRAVLFEDPGDARQFAPVEVIVRTEHGATLSIVQDNGPGFHAGERVVILRGDRTRLTKPG